MERKINGQSTEAILEVGEKEGMMREKGETSMGSWKETYWSEESV